MRLISWNVNGRKGQGCVQQADALLERAPDLIALQEVTAVSAPLWRARLAEASFSVLSTVDLRSGRKYCNLIATRWPAHMLEGLDSRYTELENSYPEKYIATRSGTVELHVAHVPPGSSVGIGKVEALEAIHRRMARTTYRPLILCGDFNAPKHEAADGRITTWGAKHPAHRDRWKRAELGVLVGLGVFGLRDVYRGRHGYGPQPTSWAAPNAGRRYDHIFASSDLATQSCDYIHQWRTERLSDHSAIEAIFEETAARSRRRP